MLHDRAGNVLDQSVNCQVVYVSRAHSVIIFDSVGVNSLFYVYLVHIVLCIINLCALWSIHFISLSAVSSVAFNIRSSVVLVKLSLYSIT